MPKGQGRPNSTPGTAVSDPLSARDIPSTPPKAPAFCDWREKIRRLLKARGWSPSQLATRAGLQQRTVSYILSTGRQPRVGYVVAIARVLAISMDWLFDDDQPWPPPATERPEHAVPPAEAELLDLVVKASGTYLIPEGLCDEVLRQLLARAIRRAGLNVPPALLDSAPANAEESQQEQGGRAIPRSEEAR